MYSHPGAVASLGEGQPKQQVLLQCQPLPHYSQVPLDEA